MINICHAVLAAPVGVVVGFSALLVVLGWTFVLVYERPLTGGMIILLGALAIAIDKRDAEQRYCHQKSNYDSQYSKVMECPRCR